MATTNYCLKLDGVSMHATLADDSDHDYATGNAFSIGMWFRLDADYQDSYSERTYLFDREDQHGLYINGGKLFYYFNGNTAAVTWNTGVRVEPEKTYFVCITGAESTNTTLKIYLNGELKNTKLVSGTMPDDVAKSFYIGIDYDTTSGYYFKGTLTGWFQSADTTISAANVTTIWNSGTYDIDTTEAITGLDDSIGFEENTGTAYDNALNSAYNGAGVNTPVWVDYLDLGQKTHTGQFMLTAVGEMVSDQLFIKKIVWESGDITATDVLELVDNNDKSVFHVESRADNTGEWQDFDPPLHTNGLKVKTLAAGYVHVYLA